MQLIKCVKRREEIGSSSKSENATYSGEIKLPSDALLEINEGAFVSRLIESDPTTASALVEYFVLQNESQSKRWTSALVGMAIDQTSHYCRRGLYKYMLVLGRVSRLEDSPELISARAEIIIPRLMDRVDRLIERSSSGDYQFIHLALDIIIWSAHYVPHTRRLLLMRNLQRTQI